MLLWILMNNQVKMNNSKKKQTWTSKTESTKKILIIACYSVATEEEAPTDCRSTV